MNTKLLTLQERINFAIENAKVGDKCKVFKDGATLHDGIIVALATDRIGRNSFAKIFKARNRENEWNSGDPNPESAQWFPFKYAYGGIALLGENVKFNSKKSLVSNIL
jgi:hypothetical protein